ncbi:glycosyltransferase [Halobellus sp. Atlit-38R]|uniref:glycosyltransferase n=1 Tax=Halobellus sp. Atlit-38R TaxID=2282131 RepID=UPI0011C41FF8|nr:glycosyltransferase [Halobellus sp. Atlit-38R]
MNILHIGNTAGVATALRNGQRQLGHKSDILIISKNQNEYEYDYRFEISNSPSIVKRMISATTHPLKFQRLIQKYDILHFHFHSIIGRGPFPKGLEFPLWKVNNKKVIKHHHGTDVRATGPSFFERKFADARLVSTPDLLQWDPDAELLLNPIDVSSINYVGTEIDHKSPLTVVHAPTDRENKGTKYLIESVENLRENGFNIELQIVENVSHNEVLERFAEADVVADQFLRGWHGMISLEAMALGKPVIVYINEEYDQYATNMPVLNTSVKTIEHSLKKLIRDEGLRQQLSRDGRKYVEEHRDTEAAARKCIEIYNNL